MLSWKDVLEFANHGNLTPTRRVDKSAQEWRELLTEVQYHVTRDHGTERPFSSEMCSVFEAGIYHCVCCKTVLFDSNTKYDSRTG